MITSPPKSVVVHGPQGCGKSLNAQRLKQHFGLQRVIDGVHLNRPSWLKAKATEKPTLFLTNEAVDKNLASFEGRHVRFIPYADAAKAAGITGNG